MDQAYVAVACAGASWNVQSMDAVLENLNLILSRQMGRDGSL